MASWIGPAPRRESMNVLGISAFYHDSAACLVQDGQIVAAAQEERFTRVKHDHRFPQHALDACLRIGGITAADLDHVAFYDKPLLKFDRLLETYLAYAPAGFRSFRLAMPLWLRHKLHLPRALDRGLGRAFRGRYVFPEHHESHAASAFFPAPFDEAAILTVDGVGEWTTSSFGAGHGHRIELTHELRFPHSLGLLYSAFTYFTGFKVNSGEYKLMGLAPYGKPRFKRVILDRVVDLKADGSFRLNMAYFEYCQGLKMTSRRIDDLLEGPPRPPESALTQREMDIAASIQAVTEEILVRMARTVSQHTGLRNLVMAGGVALNCVANGRILREGVFDDLWIQPAAGDAGGALGAALFVWHQLLDNPRAPLTQTGRGDRQRGSLLGPSFGSEQVRAILDEVGAVYTHIPDEAQLIERITDEIIAGHVVGHFHGPMEFGPRALGNRSIIGDARSPKMQSIMNLKIKFRESFRPFAPSVLRDHVHEWFDVRAHEDSPYMLLVAPVRAEHRRPPEPEGPRPTDAIERLLAAPRSTLPATTHVDYSARVQTVDAERHGRYHRLIERFRQRTGCPVIINTSFNVRGEPIVCTPHDAHRCFMGTQMDTLVVEDCVLSKAEQPEAQRISAAAYVDRFELD